ncbi:OmpH family outer membrane protein [soil metagenome]
MRLTTFRRFLGLAGHALVLAVATVGFAAPASAQEVKIGYISIERILRESAPAKASQQKLEAEFAKRAREIDDMAGKLKAASEKLDRDAPAITDVERNRRQRELMEQDRDCQRRKSEYSEDINRRKNEELGTVLERANRVVRQIAESEKFDLIVQEVVYISPRIDITDKVIKALGASPAPVTSAK